MQQLDIGEIAQIDTQWWDANGDPAEPSAITLVVTAPDGTDTTIVKASMAGSESVAGSGTNDVWSALHTVDAAGLWRFVPTGVVDTATVTQPAQFFLVGVDSDDGPCEPWCRWDEVVACATGLDALEPSAREMTIDIASAILYDLTDRRYSGVCTRTASLCMQCGTCGPVCCSCAPRHGIDLGTTPVWGAWDVVVDGVTLPTTAYTVIDRRYLTRLGDGVSWPRGTDVRDPSAFRASWAYGRIVPVAGRRAAALFAAEIAKGCLGMECEIPQRISSITREGVSYPVLDSLSMIQEGRTGVALTDLWVVADKKGRKVKPGMYSAGARGVTRTTL